MRRCGRCRRRWCECAGKVGEDGRKVQELLRWQDGGRMAEEMAGEVQEVAGRCSKGCADGRNKQDRLSRWQEGVREVQDMAARRRPWPEGTREVWRRAQRVGKWGEVEGMGGSLRRTRPPRPYCRFTDAIPNVSASVLRWSARLRRSGRCSLICGGPVLVDAW